jgi:hypothetical protein
MRVSGACVIAAASADVVLGDARSQASMDSA